MYAKYILNYGQTQLSVSREPFPFIQCTCNACKWCSLHLPMVFFPFFSTFCWPAKFYLHVCLICGFFCRNNNFFFVLLPLSVQFATQLLNSENELKKTFLFQPFEFCFFFSANVPVLRVLALHVRRSTVTFFRMISVH